MSEVPNTPTDVPASPAAIDLRQGDRADIQLIGFYKDKRHHGNNKRLMAKAYTGFIKPNGKKEIKSCRTGASTEMDAKTKVENFLTDLRARYDAFSAPERHAQAGSATAVSGEATTEQLMDNLLARWKGDPKRQGCIVGYRGDGKAFIRLSGDLARRTPDQYTQAECEKIRDERLSELNPATRAPNQCMRNLRFVLNEIPGFPQKLIEIFCPPRKQRGQGRKPDYGFGISDRVELWKGLGTASWAERMLFYLGANGAMHLADAVFTLTSEIREARDAISRRERVKNGNPFKFVPWYETTACFDERERPDAVYLFWMFIFTPEEVKADPNILLRELTPKEKKARLRYAPSKARNCFDEYLSRIKIKRPGIAYRSFRHTDIAHFEANGVPRRVGMDVTGQSEEKTYLDYIHSTSEQMTSLSEITHDCWDPARMGRRCFLTLTQAVEAIGEKIDAGVDRVVTAVTTHTNACNETSEQRIIAAVNAHVDARFDQLRQEFLIGRTKSNASGPIATVLLFPGLPSLPPFVRSNDAASGHAGPLIAAPAPVDLETAEK